MNYLDTSALIKRFVAERGSPLIQTLVARNGTVETANRKHASACRQFESDWQAYIRVDLRGEILLLARDLIQRHPLRGFDAIHLASALAMKSALGEEITFAAADERLLRAAEAEGLRPLNVETAPAP